MDRTPPFLVRRVLMGVVAGLTVLAVGFFGWVQYRSSEYHDREAKMLARYRHDYLVCLRDQSASACVSQLRELCARDVFWQQEPPFVIDLAPQFSRPDARCTEVVAG
jgi:hypothetical protein